MSSKAGRIVAALLVGLSLHAGARADPAEEARSLSELRNTVVNLLRALVERGVITHEQAEAMVKDAEQKAATSAAATAQQEKAEQGAVRVPYVPQIVKDEIGKQVAAELGPDIKKELVDQVSSKGSLYSVLPEWVQRMRWSADMRVRGEGDYFASDNALGVYLDFNQVNAKGGIEKAGEQALLNTTEDQNRPRLRARVGFDTVLGSGWSMGMKLATGSTGEIIATTNQTLGTYGAGYTVTFDQAYIRWSGQSSTGRQLFTTAAGRFENPWVSTDLIWYNDLTWEGFDAAYRVNLTADNAYRKDLFATVGAFPLASFSPLDSNQSGQQKWLTGAQLGLDLNNETDSRLRIAATYYDYLHIVGERNTLDSTLFNWSAPAFVQKGNTMFDISNSSNQLTSPVNLFALASNFRIAEVIVVGDFHVLPAYSVGLTLEALKNLGFNSAQVEARVGQYVAPRTRGYRADLAFGSSNTGAFATWRASVGYRYLERDAVVDAFNDEDFHLGGTDAKGYTLLLDFWWNPRVWLRLKDMAAHAIDGPPLNIDVVQLDLNTRF